MRLVGDIEARGLPCPGGLSRVDWLRSLDPTVTVTAAKAVMTCAVAFNQPRWESLRDAVLIREARAGNSEQGGGADAGGGVTGRVTVGEAAQVIDFHARLQPVADPDDLEQAVGVLTEQARDLRPEDLARLARQLSDQVRPPQDAADLDQKRRDGRGL